MKLITVGFNKTFPLLGPCEGCTVHKVGCNRKIPCGACVSNGRKCEMSLKEIERRVCRVMTSVVSGVLPHCHFAMYELQQESVLYGYKAIMKRADMENCSRMLKKFGASGMRIEDSKKVPSVLMDLVKGEKFGRLEYMADGHYMFISSNEWGDEFLDFDALGVMSRKTNVVPKLVETLNIGDYTVAHRMWIESVLKPFMPITWEGKIMSKKLGRIVDSGKVTMISSVMVPNCIVTATVVKF